MKLSKQKNIIMAFLTLGLTFTGCVKDNAQSLNSEEMAEQVNGSNLNEIGAINNDLYETIKNIEAHEILKELDDSEESETLNNNSVRFAKSLLCEEIRSLLMQYKSTNDKSIYSHLKYLKNYYNEWLENNGLTASKEMLETVVAVEVCESLGINPQYYYAVDINSDNGLANVSIPEKKIYSQVKIGDGSFTEALDQISEIEKAEESKKANYDLDAICSDSLNIAKKCSNTAAALEEIGGVEVLEEDAYEKVLTR